MIDTVKEDRTLCSVYCVVVSMEAKELTMDKKGREKYIKTTEKCILTVKYTARRTEKKEESNIAQNHLIYQI